MKTKILGPLLTMLWLESVFGQGTINFENLVVVDGVRIVDAPVRYYDGTLLSGSGFMAQLYAAPGGSILSPVGAPVPFLTGTGAGYFSGGTRTVDWVQPGGAVSIVEVRVWRVASGATWEAAIDRAASIGMTIRTGGLNGAPPANLIDLQPFCFTGIGPEPCVPEPSTLALLFLGALILGARLRRR